MYFDRNNATLLASADDLTKLAEFSAASSGAIPADWSEVNVATGDQLDPTVAGIVDIMNRPLRSIALERFDGESVDVMFIAWDRAGRATMANGVGQDSLSITATQFDLLPALLTQAVRLNPATAPAVRRPITTTAGVVQQAITGANVAGEPAAGQAAASEPVASDANGDASPDQDLVAVLGAIRHAWRASGSWQGKTTDASMTVLSAGDEGLWVVSHDASTPGSQANADTVVQLEPCNPRDISRLLGDVVTGRNSVPEQAATAPSTAASTAPSDATSTGATTAA